MTTRILLATAGSLGDLHPFMAVAHALQALGLSPVIASAPDYRARVENAGLDFLPMGPSHADVEADLGMTLATLTHKIRRRPDLLYRELVFPYLQCCLDDVRPMVAESALVMTSTLAISARLAAELEGRAQVAAILQPMMWLSAEDFPIFMPGITLSRLIRALGPKAGHLARSAILGAGRIMGQPVTRFRAGLGLKPSACDPLFAGQFGSAGSVGMYSPCLGTLPTDGSAAGVITGFCFHDQDESPAEQQLAALDRFLAAGRAPLVFTLGSAAVRSAGSFFAESVRAATALGERAVLIVGDDMPKDLAADPARVHLCRYVPYSRLFPKALAVVHQGGIGTFGQALRAGCRQLIVPHFADQADNAARAIRLGVGAALRRQSCRTARLTHELAHLLANPRLPYRAQHIASGLATERGAIATAEFLANRAFP